MVKLSTFSIVAVCFLLVGCASKPSPIGPGLQVLEGKGIRTAIEYLGYPDNTQNVVGDNVYTWMTGGTYTDVYPISDHNHGHFDGYGKRGRYGHASQTYASEVKSYSCRIKMATGHDNVIKSTQALSSGGGCRVYNSAFEKILTDFGVLPVSEVLEK